MGNLIGSFGQGSPPASPPPSQSASAGARRKRGRKRGVGEEGRGEGGDVEEVEELSPRRSVHDM